MQVDTTLFHNESVDVSLRASSLHNGIWQITLAFKREGWGSTAPWRQLLAEAVGLQISADPDGSRPLVPVLQAFWAADPPVRFISANWKDSAGRSDSAGWNAAGHHEVSLAVADDGTRQCRLRFAWPAAGAEVRGDHVLAW